MTLEALIEAAAERGVARALEGRGLRPTQALTVNQAAKRLAIGPDALRKMILDGEILAYRLHGHSGEWRITDRAIEDYFAAREAERGAA